ncbi:MAG TPA: hypothetical protein VF739_14875 [Ktedonobacterales bacterium]
MDDQQPFSLTAAPEESDALGVTEKLATPATPDAPSAALPEPLAGVQEPDAAPIWPEAPDWLDAPTPPADVADDEEYEEYEEYAEYAPDVADQQQDIAFLAPSPTALRLADSAVYRPSGLVGLALIAGPAICVGIAAPSIGTTGHIPLWLPIALLLWLPALALVWALLKSVRLTPEGVACGRALGQWSMLGFDEIERIEQHGPRLVISGRRNSQTISFTPALLSRGGQLRRTLLLQLPLRTLVGALRAESQRLSVGDEMAAGDISGVLTVHTRRFWPIGALALALALLALGVALLVVLGVGVVGLVALAVALALALLCGLLGLWSAQAIFVSEKGLVIQYPLLRRESDVYWTQVQQIGYAPREVALLYRGASHTAYSIGPGLLTPSQARLMRQYINRYSQADIVPAWPRRAGG